MSKKESIQEAQYEFPYHYLTSTKGGVFSMTEYLQWGLMHQSYIEYLTEKISKLNFQKLLDAGCGEGRLLYEIEQKVSGKYLYGIDISSRALHFGRGFTKQSKFEEHDIIKSPTSELFDICTSIEVIEHIPPEYIPKYVENISRSLVERGILIITTPTDNYPVHRKHYQHFNSDKLNELLSPYFEITETIFLNKENYFSRMLARLLANKYFIMNQKQAKSFIYKIYKRHYLNATNRDGSRILIVATRK